jgi:lipopolysaccharide transport system permease protein
MTSSAPPEKSGPLAPAVSEPAHQAQLEPPEIIISTDTPWKLLDVGEIWRYRELLGILIWRDIKVRYKQTALGALWALLQPLLTMVVFWLFFGRLAQMPSGGIPYPLFAYCGLAVWWFFATGIANAGNSIIESERLVTKVYFPRILMPFASVGAALVDWMIAFGFLLVLMAAYGVYPGWSIAFVPVVMVAVCLAALGVGAGLAALNVTYRDFRYVIPFLVQLWMFATPSIYMDLSAPTPGPATSGSTSSANSTQPAGALPGSLRTALGLNPMTGLVESFRAAMFGRAVPWGTLALSVAMVLVFFVGGCLVFRYTEESFADVI